MGTQAIVIYGGFAHPSWNGYHDQINLTNTLDCSYCYNPLPCRKKPERLCMRQISVDDVLKYLEDEFYAIGVIL